MRTYVRLSLLSGLVVAMLVLAGRGAPTGHAWSGPDALNTNAATDSGHDHYPQVTTDGTGNWVAVWYSLDTLGGTIGSDYDILVSSSTDNGSTWSAPAALNTNAATDSGRDWVPQVTTDGLGNWVAVWYSEENVGGTIGTDEDILVARSTDNGATWTAPAALNTNASTDLGDDERSHVTTDSAGNWVVVWTSADDLSGTIGTDWDILVARSTDNGATWTAPAVLNINAATDSGDDYTPQVTTDGAGNWVVAWYSTENLGGTIGTDRDILVAHSTDNGASWTFPAALNTNASIDAGDDTFPQVATDGGDNWVAVWYSGDDLGGTIGTDDDILTAHSSDNGITWTTPIGLNTNAPTDSGHDEMAHVATDGAGNWVAVWESRENLGGTIGTDWDILVSRSADTGAIWTAPVPVNANAATDSGVDRLPDVTTDGAGKWLAVWSSTENVGGTIGGDYDILMARPTDDDGDGRTDLFDNCPDDYNPDQLDTDGDGLGDACDTDDDDDGVADDTDVWCPLLPEDFDGYQDADGCPDTDNDLDGRPDTEEGSMDTDGDTVPDTSCLNIPEDYDAFEDGDGCPEPDNDGDGFPDTTDQCPATDWTAGPDGIPCTGDDNVDTCEDYDGIIDTDGCHDSPGDDYDGDSMGRVGVGGLPMFWDEVEVHVGTDPTDACSDQPGDSDAWPPDMAGPAGCGTPDANVNILDVSCYKPKLPPNPYDPRYDLNADGEVNILDVLLYKVWLGESCVNL